MDGRAGLPGLSRAAGARLGDPPPCRVVRADVRPAQGASAAARRPSGRSSAPGPPITTSRPTAPTSSLLECRDGRRIECVLMAEDPRRTVCISTQVGCGMGCVFCASGLKGVERNLTSGEILEQVLHAPQPPAARGDRHPHRRHGDGGEPGEPRQPGQRPRPALFGRGGAGDQPAAGDHLDGRTSRRRSASSRRWTGNITWRSRCTHRPRRCGTSWCRSTRRSV